jgi:hypothetical protein
VSAIAERRRRRTVAMLVVTVLVLLAMPVLGYVGARAVLDSTGGTDAQADNLPVQPLPPTPTALYLSTDATGALSSAAVFVLSPTMLGGSIVPLAVNADVGFAPEARQSLQDVFAQGGVDAAVLAVESLTLVTINHVEVADESAVAGFLLPFAPLTVDLVADVATASFADPNAQPLTAGTAVLDAGAAAKVLTEPAATSAAGQNGHRANTEALWAAVSIVVGGGRPTGATGAVPGNFNEFTAGLFAGPVASRGIAVLPLEGDENPNGLDVVQVDRADAVFVFASIAPASMSGPSPGLLFRVEAPPGYDAAVKSTIEKLLYFGANIVSIDTNAAPRPDTVFVVPDDVIRDEAMQTNGIFGSVSFEDPTVRIDGVDLTVVLGTDYLARASS